MEYKTKLAVTVGGWVCGVCVLSEGGGELCISCIRALKFNDHNFACGRALMTLQGSVLQVVLVTVYESHLISFSRVHGPLWCHTSPDYFSVSVPADPMGIDGSRQRTSGGLKEI